METKISQPKQRRSAATLSRILESARKVIAKGEFTDATVADIVAGAGASVGAFYSRFKDKEALFFVIQEAFLDDLMTLVSSRMESFQAGSSHSGERLNTHKVADFMVDLFIDLYGYSPGLMRALYIHTRIKRDPVLYDQISLFNSASAEKSFSILSQLCKEAPSSDQRQAWVACLSVVGSYLREAMLFGDPMPMNPDAARTSIRKTAVKTFKAMLDNSPMSSAESES